MFYFILLIAAFLRLYRLSATSLWFDEASQLISSELFNFKNIIASMREIGLACPLYSTFIFYWKHLGNSDVILRLSSVIFGMGCVVGIYHLGKMFFDKKTGMISAFILAISPFHIYYSQELRMYALISLLTIICTYSLFKALNENKNRYWAIYIIFNALNLYIHYMTVLILLALIIFFLIYFQHYKLLLRKWLISHVLLILLLMPWLLITMSRIMLIIEKKDFYWIPSWLPAISLKNVFFTFKNFSIGYNATTLVYLLAFGLYFALFFWGIAKTKIKKELMLCLCCLFIPVFLMFLFSQWKVWYVDRYVISSSIFFYLIIAKGLSVLKNLYLILALIFITILSVFALRNYYNNILPGTWVEHIGLHQPKEQHREAADYIAENFQKNDIILYTCRNVMPSLKWYFSLKDNKLGLDKRYNIILNFPGDSCKQLPCDYKNDEFQFKNDYSKEVPLEGHDRVWLVFSGFEFEKEKHLGSPAMEVVNWMEKHYSRKDIKKFNGINVYLYTKFSNSNYLQK